MELFKAIWQQNLPFVEKLAKEDKFIDLDQKDERGFTPLHYSASLGNSQIANLLIDSGSLLDLGDRHGNTPLHLAVAEGALDVATSLIENGTDVNSQNEKGCTALFVAAGRGHLALVKLLLENNAKPSICNLEGVTALHAAMSSSAFDAELAALLVEFGADVDAQDESGDSPLHWAVRESNLAAVGFLLKVGAKVDIPNEDGETPLMMAVECNESEIGRLLVAGGAEISESELTDSLGLEATSPTSSPSTPSVDALNQWLDIWKGSLKKRKEAGEEEEEERRTKKMLKREQEVY